MSSVRSLAGLSLPGLLLSLSLAASCGGSDTTVTESSGTIGVTVEVARTETLRDVASASGTVVPSVAADWTVIATDQAEILELPKKANDPVNSGDVLVRLDIPSMNQELSALELAVIDANARNDRAKSELARLTGLFERGLASRNQYDQARLEESAAGTALVQARTQLESVKVAENRAVIRARFNGVVTDVFRTVGQSVRPTPEDAILRVIDPTRVQVSVQLPVIQLARVLPGQSATVQAIAGATAEAATVLNKADLLDASAPTGEVRLGFVVAATLPVNTPVSAEILLDQRTNALTIPLAGVRRDELGWFVILVGDDGLAHRRDVRVGLTTRDRAQIVAGLVAGEGVVTSTIDDVREGTPVIVAR